MRNVLDKSCRENQNTHFMFNNFLPENRTVYKIMPKTIVETEGPQMTSQYGANAWRAAKARLYACMRAHAHAHALGYSHARTHTQTNM